MTQVANKVTRGDIRDLESAMKEMPQVDIQIRHYQVKGLYAREMYVPKGVTFVGKIHKCEHISVISKGKFAVATEEESYLLEAPATFTSQPGTKRAGLALEDSVWTTFHPIEETDIEKIEAQLVTDNWDDIKLLEEDKS